MSQAAASPTIETVRQFNRFYTRQIGVLHEGLLKSPYSLTEVRVLYELAHRKQPTAKNLCTDLGLDAGYLSRILAHFEQRGLVRKKSSASDGRRNLLSLTAQGRKVFGPLEARAQQEVTDMVGKLSVAQQSQLLEAMLSIQTLLRPKSEVGKPYTLRSHRPGDIGWIVYRHGILYSHEYGYDERFEALVAEIVAEFVQNFDSRRERCWIAERQSEIVGSVFLVQKSQTVAKLRLLLVEPSARGLGIGKRLVDECVRFARQVGYKKIVLWTQSELKAARHLYQRAGFRLIEEKPHHSWGQDLIAETWELKL
jgi:DNA-binding MarR family transcriptional regulator/N-acetylglutamate synthase-like GNAT family acetyltransferase